MAAVSERLKSIIKEHGGYDKVSEKIGINRQTLIRIATGKTDPKLSQVIKIAELSKFTLDELIYEEFAPFLKDIAQSERVNSQEINIHELMHEMRDNILRKYQWLDDRFSDLFGDFKLLESKFEALEAEVKNNQIKNISE